MRTDQHLVDGPLTHASRSKRSRNAHRVRAAFAAWLSMTFAVTAHATLLAPTATMSFSPSSVYVGTEDPSQLTITLANANPQQLTGVGFLDSYPAGFLNLNPNVLSNTCGGATQLLANGSSLELSGATIQGNASCAVTVLVWGYSAASWLNDSGPISSANAPSGSGASATLAVHLFAAPTVTKTFVPADITPGGVSRMVITLHNPNVADITRAAMSDFYPSGLTNAASFVLVENTCGGTFNPQPNFTSVFSFGGTIPALGSCTIAANVTGASAGNLTNTTSPVSSSNAADSLPAAATLNIAGGALLPAPAVSEIIVPQAPQLIAIGGNADITIKLTNSNAQAITGVQLHDSFPDNLLTAGGNLAIHDTTCGGTLTAPENGNFIDLADGTIPANDFCVITVRAVAIAAGQVSNSTGPVASANAQLSAGTAAALNIQSAGTSFAPTLAKTFAPALIAVGETSQMTITLTNPNPLAVVGLVVNDAYPPGILNAPSNALVSNSCGGTTNILGDGFTGSAALFLNGGVIPPSDSCSIVVNVVGAAIGNAIVNTVGATSSNAQTPASASATLTVTPAPPQADKAFVPASIVVGGASQMSITLTNPNVQAVTGVAFSDTYPAGLANASGGQDVLYNNTCGGSVSATPMGTSLALSGATIQPHESCKVEIAVISTGAAPGSIANTTGHITSIDAPDGANAVGTLTVTGGALLTAPTVTKNFSPSTVTAGGTSQMTITLTNTNAQDITGVQFTDPYPSGMQNAADGIVGNSVVVSNTCGGAPDALVNATASSLGNGTIPANGDCSIVVNVVGTAAGPLTNVTGQIFSANAATGSAATATLNVVPGALLNAPTAMKDFSPASVTLGESSSMTITLNNPNAQDITGVQFTDIYPPGIANADAGGGTGIVSNTCAGTPKADPNGHSAALANGTIVGNQCSIVVKVVATATGNPLVNQTGAIPSANAHSGSSVNGALTVSAGPLLQAPTVAKSFVPSTVWIGATSQMSITLTNPNPNDAIVGASLHDSYPSFMLNAPTEPVVSDSCGFTQIVPANGNAAALHGGTIPAGGACSIVINVVGTSDGDLTNDTGPVSSVNAQAGADATAILHVLNHPLLLAPTVTKSFAPSSIAAGDTSQMTITLSNHNPLGRTIFGAQVNDFYPPGIVNASGNPVLSDTCNFSEDVPANAGWAKLANGTVAGGGSCNVVISVVGTSTANNQTGSVPSGNANTGSSASATLTVNAGGANTPQTITFTSTAPLNATVGGPTYLPTATATSGLPVSLTIDAIAASVCTIDNNGNVSFIGAGMCTIDANQAGGMNNGTDYAPAAQVQQPFSVTSAGGTAQTITFASTAPANATVGGPTYVAAATATSGLPVVLTIDGASATVCTIDAGLVDFIGAGTCTIDANQAGGMSNGTDYAPASQVQQPFSVASAGGTATQTITFTSAAPASATVGGPTYTATATATSGLPVVLTIDGASATVCVINAGAIAFIGAGTCTIDANQGGGMNNGTNYAPASQLKQSFAVAGAGGQNPQAITFTSTAPVDATVAGSTYLATATASSLLSVALTIDGASATVCAINNGIVTFIGAGTCTIDANQGGDTSFAPASEVQQSFAVASAGGVTPQAITFTSATPVDATVAGPTYLATATASSGLPVVLTIENTSATVCAINNGTVTFIGAGTCTIDANQGGDVTYALAPEAQQSFMVASAGGATPQMITFTSTAPLDATVAGTTYFATAAASSGLPVVLTIEAMSATVCAINNGIVAFIGAGTCTIDANQGGDATYAPAPQTQQPFVVASAGGASGQMITFTSTAPVDATVAGPTYLATATASSDLPVVLTIDGISAAVCTINDGTVSFIGSGTCMIDANQGGDATFVPALEQQQSFAVNDGSGAPTVTCVLQRQVNVVGDTVNLDLSLLFAPPPGESLAYSGTNLPASLSIIGSLLTGTLQASDVPPSPPYAYASTLTATTMVPGGLSASEDVTFEVLPAGEILLRNGFDGATANPPCQ